VGDEPAPQPLTLGLLLLDHLLGEHRADLAQAGAAPLDYGRRALACGTFSSAPCRENCRQLIGANSRLEGAPHRRDRVVVDILDLRCSNVVKTSDVKARCQLRVGHYGLHAAGILDDDNRQMLLRWITGASPDVVPYEQDGASGPPWVPGLPAAHQLLQ
jgi:hypothetical protein